MDSPGVKTGIRFKITRFANGGRAQRGGAISAGDVTCCPAPGNETGSVCPSQPAHAFWTPMKWEPRPSDFVCYRINPNPDGFTPYRKARQAGNALLYLPHEIRDSIYAFYAVAELEATQQNVIGSPEEYRPAALMKTCKQMWIEAEIEWFRSHTFLLESYFGNEALVSWFDQQRRFDAYQNVKQLAFGIFNAFFDGPDVHLRTAVEDVQKLFLARCTHLQRLDIAASSEFRVMCSSFKTYSDYGIEDLLRCKRLQHLGLHIETLEELPIFEERDVISWDTASTTERRQISEAFPSDYKDGFASRFKEQGMNVNVSCSWFYKWSDSPGYYAPSIFGRTFPFVSFYGSENGRSQEDDSEIESENDVDEGD